MASKNRETIHLHLPPPAPRRSVVVTEGPPDLVALEPTPAAHSPTAPVIAAVAGFDLSDADIEQAAREVAAEERAPRRRPPRATGDRLLEATLLEVIGTARADLAAAGVTVDSERMLVEDREDDEVPIPTVGAEVARLARAPDHRR